MLNCSKRISLPILFSEGDPVEWFQRFEICCCTNNWDDTVKAKKLPTLLDGEAIVVWFELTPKGQKVYSSTKEKIVKQIVPAILYH